MATWLKYFSSLLNFVLILVLFEICSAHTQKRAKSSIFWHRVVTPPTSYLVTLATDCQLLKCWREKRAKSSIFFIDLYMAWHRAVTPITDVIYRNPSDWLSTGNWNFRGGYDLKLKSPASRGKKSDFMKRRISTLSMRTNYSIVKGGVAAECKGKNICFQTKDKGGKLHSVPYLADLWNSRENFLTHGTPNIYFFTNFNIPWRVVKLDTVVKDILWDLETIKLSSF